MKWGKCLDSFGGYVILDIEQYKYITLCNQIKLGKWVLDWQMTQSYNLPILSPIINYILFLKVAI